MKSLRGARCTFFLAGGSAWVIALALSVGPAGATDEPDELIPGRVVVIKTGKLIKFVAKPPAGRTFDLPDAVNAPFCGVVVLQIFDTNSGESNNYRIDDDSTDRFDWKGLGHPAGSKGFKYQGKKTVSDPCAVLIRASLIKAVCRGRAVTLNPPFVGDVGIVLNIGNFVSGAVPHCQRGSSGSRVGDVTV